METNDICIVVTITEKREEAARIAEALLNAQLAACVQIQAIESLYRWEGKLVHGNEYRLEIKSRLSLYAEAEKLIRNLHSYDLPEIVVIPIIAGSDDYLHWVEQELHREKRR